MQEMEQILSVTLRARTVVGEMCVHVCVFVHVHVRGCSSMSQWLMGLESDT